MHDREFPDATPVFSAHSERKLNSEDWLNFAAASDARFSFGGANKSFSSAPRRLRYKEDLRHSSGQTSALECHFATSDQEKALMRRWFGANSKSCVAAFAPVFFCFVWSFQENLFFKAID